MKTKLFILNTFTIPFNGLRINTNNEHKRKVLNRKGMNEYPCGYDWKPIKYQM